MERVVVMLHLKSNVVKKVWRFEPSRIEQYSRSIVEDEISKLFPDVSRKGLRLNLWYEDDIAGKVIIESNGDLQEALVSFAEVANSNLPAQYRTIHVEECLEVMIEREDRREPLLEPAKPPSSSKKRGTETNLSELPPKKSKKISDPVQPVPLDKVLLKCTKEEGVSEEDQPLYIDTETESIKCKWCGLFKGSIEARVINQHSRSSKAHLKERKKRLNPEEIANGIEEANEQSQERDNSNRPSNDHHLQSCSDQVTCQGLHDRKFEVLYDDGNSGATTSKKLWIDSHAGSGLVYSSDKSKQVKTHCTCCREYNEWKEKHLTEAELLQKIADMPCYYKVCDEQIKVFDKTYQSTIRALCMAPKGECSGVAYKSGPHPYTCEACEALQHGKNSQLLHKLHRASTLKYPRSVQNRANQSGVTHKFCSKAHLECALQTRRLHNEYQAKKLTAITKTHEELLSESWKNNASARPFIEQLLKLVEANKLSEFDLGFLNNWLGKKVKGRYHHASDQARSLAILLSNRLGEKLYTTIAPIMGLPLSRQAQRLRAGEGHQFTYMPGLNEWAFQVASKNIRPFHNSMDGTRIVRIIELYQNEYLVGESFSPDVRMFPTPEQLMRVESQKQLRDYILSVRQNNRYAAEAYSFDLVDTTGEFPDMLLGSIPEATSGVTASHIYSLMLTVEQKAEKYNLSLVGHCTDSASNALNALLKLATPTQHLVKQGVSFLGLNQKSFYLFAPFFHSHFPSITYSCWDHSARTVLRNLINRERTIIAELYSKKDSKNKHPKTLECRNIATIQDLCHLKAIFPNSTIKHGDISPYIKQNCDATSRVLTQSTIEELCLHVPGSQGTQLYLQAAVWTHAPYRNDKFGSPPDIVKSLWAGIMTWRRWRQYIIITPETSLTENFISRPHYLTEELLVHAGINHLLCLFLCFPNCDLSEYNLRHTGNRGIEAIHGMFRGGTSSLPITSPNFSFREFLEKMNAAQQIKRAEHSLSNIKGSTIVASKKKRKTFAITSDEGSSQHTTGYCLPETYEDFVAELKNACNEGNEDSKKVIERLAPHMATTLINAQLKGQLKGQQWETPSVPLDDVPTDIHIIKNLEQVKMLDSKFLSSLVAKELGALDEPLNGVNDQSQNSEESLLEHENEHRQALANMLLDVAISDDSESNDNATTSLFTKGKLMCHNKAVHATSILKGLQPQWEKPSKDRGKRFAAGDLLGNRQTNENEIQELQFWTLYPQSKVLKSAKLFLLGQISLVLSEGKLCSSVENNNSTEIVLNLYEYNHESASYTVKGKTTIYKAPAVLKINVTNNVIYIQDDYSAVKLQYTGIEELHEYLPFSLNVDIDSRIERFSPDETFESTCSESEEYIVEQILKKQFNSKLGQYEFFVKWKGYSEKHNTWELITNIPDTMITQFELDNATLTLEETSRSGLRDRRTIKPKFDPNFISS